jgi:hypothetical protein
MKYLIVILAVVAIGCDDDSFTACEHLAERCDGDVIQVCNADGYWEDVKDCMANWQFYEDYPDAPFLGGDDPVPMTCQIAAIDVSWADIGIQNRAVCREVLTDAY